VGAVKATRVKAQSGEVANRGNTAMPQVGFGDGACDRSRHGEQPLRRPDRVASVRPRARFRMRTMWQGQKSARLVEHILERG
jgi:hypothetical protein